MDDRWLDGHEGEPHGEQAQHTPPHPTPPQRAWGRTLEGGGWAHVYWMGMEAASISQAPAPSHIGRLSWAHPASPATPG